MNIKEFDYKDIPEHGTMLLVASRKSGKSVLMVNMLYHHFIKTMKVKRFLIISPTLHNGDYLWMESADKRTSFDENFLDELLEDQHERMKSDPASAPLVIVLDDIIKSTNEKTKNAIARLFCCGRHSKITIALVSQSLKYEISPAVKINVDVVFLFSTRNYDNKKEISDLWLGFSNKEDRDIGFTLMDKIAKGYRSMVILNTKKSDVIEEIVFFKEIDIDKNIPRNYIF